MAALQGPQDSVEKMRTAFDVRRKAIVAWTNQIPGMSSILPTGAFYTMPNISGTGVSAKAMERFLLETLHIAAIAGTSFGAFGEGYIRFSYANSIENIEKALNRIRDYAESEGWEKLST
jgi:aspartate/methionine/tyrosine aminotransferase